MNQQPPGERINIDGVDMYVNGDRMWVAADWDNMFLPKVNKNITPKPKNYKGENPCKKFGFIKGVKCY